MEKAGSKLPPESEELRLRMANIGRKILVLSGKGGVGKSTVAAGLALSLARAGERVGLLDADIHGPSIPGLLDLKGVPVHIPGLKDEDEPVIFPIEAEENLFVLSIGSLLNDPAAAVIWRGPMKYNMIRQFLGSTEWGDLDVLVVDLPPGTGDEPLSVVQLIGDSANAVVVTTPQELAVADVRRCITFCNRIELPVLGVIENMSGLACPHCKGTIDLFGTGGGSRLAAEFGVPFLGRVPLDPQIAGAAGRARSFPDAAPDSPAATAFAEICRNLEPTADKPGGQETVKDTSRRIAIPITEGKLATHFGHCRHFALVDIDSDSRTVGDVRLAEAPDHQPGLLPRWLAAKGVNTIIAGGMGQRALSLFREAGIEVVVGARTDAPEVIVRNYLSGTLVTGSNVCDH